VLVRFPDVPAEQQVSLSVRARWVVNADWEGTSSIPSMVRFLRTEVVDVTHGTLLLPHPHRDA